MGENKKTMRVSADGISLTLDCESLGYEIEVQGRVWKTDDTFAAGIVYEDGGRVPFGSAQISHRYYGSGVGTGILTSYSLSGYSFETLAWIEYSTKDIHFELIPGSGQMRFRRIEWPGYFVFEGRSERAYTVMPVMQGLLIPNTWENEVSRLPFGGQMCSAGAYMPWFGQVDAGDGYIAVCETPWDAGYYIDHPANGPYTHVGMYFLPSLGDLAYRRSMRYHFMSGCDYNDLCKFYRSFVKERGLFTSLDEKAARSPLVDRLIGSVFVHTGIKTHVSENSRFYDPGDPDKNNMLVPFSVRTRQIRRYRQMGVKKLYLHLDGWGEPGYDNMHPDYLPPCAEAGGWEGLRDLSDTVEECGYLLGLHDQYRDYYKAAATYDEEFAIRSVDGSVFEMACWAGGPQNYLCATQAPYYVKRNFEELFSHGIHPGCAYLDVFSCNEPDECAHPHHRMSRRECLEYRNSCFAYLWSRGILPSSEECGDWAMNQLLFCHYGPYDFMLEPPGSPGRGIPVPLFNLVYHDCMILPWPMEKGEEDYMLYAVLNGGAAYLERDGAYPDTDGSFDRGEEFSLEEKISRAEEVAALQEKVAKCEMVRHEFIDGDLKRQRSTFSDGTAVEIDLAAGTYSVTHE